MKNEIIKILALMVLTLAFSSICFAQEESGNSPFLVDEAESGTYITNVDDFNSLMQDVGTDDYSDLTSTSTDAEQLELKGYYDEQVEMIKTSYAEFKLEDPVQAKVIEASEPYEYYDFSSYYSVDKMLVQKIKLSILAGDYKGTEFETLYYLTEDSLFNAKHPSLTVGDKVLVRFDETEDKVGVQVYTVDRLIPVICLAVVAFILLIIYAGKKGLVAVLSIIATGLIAFVIIPLLGYEGRGFIFSGLLGVAVISAIISLVNFGLSKRTLQAFGVSILITVLGLIVLIVGSSLTKTSGITLEAVYGANQIYVGSFNYTELFYMTAMIIISAVIAHMVASVIHKLDSSNADTFEEKVNDCRNILISHIVVGTAILAILYIPNHIPLLTNKLTTIEIINSETFVTELVRIFALIVSATLVIPICSLETFKFGKKYLNESKELKKEPIKEVNKTQK